MNFIEFRKCMLGPKQKQRNAKMHVPTKKKLGKVNEKFEWERMTLCTTEIP